MRIVALRNVNDVVHYVSGTHHTVAVILAAAKLFQELKNSSDMLPVTQPTIPNSIFPTGLAYR
jgi:heme A synthase